jgi:hypothetical protein
VKTRGQPRLGWTTVLRRQPGRLVEGQTEGGYTSVFEIIRCGCGDDPGLDYCEVSPGPQRVRGPYPIKAGFAAYVRHVQLHQQPGRRYRPGPVADAR